MGLSMRSVLLCGCAALLASCSSTSHPVEDERPKAGIIGGSDDLRRGEEPAAHPTDVAIDIRSEDIHDEEITDIRYSGLREAAQTYGSQKGYARRSWEILGLIERQSGQLSEAFSFQRLVTGAPQGAGYIVPPIVSRSFSAFEGDGRRAAVADEFLTVVSAGRISPVVPTWRDYLLLEVGEVEEPARSLLPEDRHEREIFRSYFDEGWKAGVELADESLDERLSRLIRDYAGMLEYRRLVSQGMMDRLVLRDADYGVTGGGEEMRIGERTVEIVSDAEFRADPDFWSPAVVTDFERQIVESGGLDALVDH